MKLIEIYNTTLNIVWQKQGRFELSRFSYADVIYDIQIEQHNFTGISDLNKGKTAEVSFSRADKDGDASFSSTNSAKIIPTAVFGIVKNAFFEKFSYYDAFYAIANKRHSNNDKQYKQKIQIYANLFSAIKSSYQKETWYYENSEANEHYFLLSKTPIEDSGNFKNPLQEARLIFNK